MYLHHILTRDPDELILKIYKCQLTVKTQKDWGWLVQEENRKYNIDLCDDEIAKMSKKQFKKLIDDAVNREAFRSLMSSEKSKVQSIIKCTQQAKDGKSKPQDYLLSKKLSTREKQTLFELRTRNFNCKSNQKSSFLADMTCRWCLNPNSYEDEKHTFQECTSLIDETKLRLSIQDVFGTLEEQVNFVKHAIPIIRKRTILTRIQSSHPLNVGPVLV